MYLKINWFLYCAAFCVNLLSLIVGVAYTWTSPILPKLNNEENLEDNPFGRAITPFEESWIASILNVGAAIGPFIGVLFIDRIGRKKILLLLAVPMIASHLILAFATDVNLYYFSRFLLGLSVGCVFSIVPIYVGEIAENSNRGALSFILSSACTVATVLCFAIAPYLSIKIFCLILLVPIIAFLILFGFFFPESPYYLLMVKREDEARLALTKLRLVFVEKEFEDIKKYVEISTSTHFKLKDSLKSRAIRKGLLLGCGLMFFQQFSGITVFLAYMQSIFDASGTTLSPEISAIIISVVQVIANLLAIQLVDRLGRRILLLVSLTGAFFSNTLLGIYFYLKLNDFDDVVSYLSWLPVCCLLFYMAVYTSGLGPVPWAMTGELFPTHFKAYASTFVSFVCLFMAFVLTLFFPNLTQLIGMGFSFWIFAGCCAMGVIFVWKVVPETKGKSLHEIQQMLEGVLTLENDVKMSK